MTLDRSAPWPYPFWIAHRGGGRLAPENTLAAFRVGAAHGYTAYECDVKLSADEVPFLLHDDDLARTTATAGPAGARPWAALSRLDAGARFGRGFAGEPIPSLDAIAAFVLGNGHALNIELKAMPGTERRTGEVVAAAASRLWPGDALPPLLSSFSAVALEGAREGAPALPRALLLDRFDEGWLERAAALGCVAVVMAHALVDAAAIERLHAAGLAALAYTVNAVEDVGRLVDLAIDGLITDALDRFAPARRRG